MMPVEVHLFHGFLGQPTDWHSIVERIQNKNRIIKCHNLVEDFLSLGESPSFADWTRLKEVELKGSSNLKVIVGYSLGGRLAMNLPHTLYSELILVGAHPGLVEGKETREKQENDWEDLLDKSSGSEWLSLWNKQEIFKNDQVRPLRNYSKEELLVHIQIMKAFSLSKQEDMVEKIKSNRKRIRWVCGEEDEKYRTIYEKMGTVLSEKNVKMISEAGHGVVFDSPDKLSLLIEEVIKSVENN